MVGSPITPTRGHVGSSAARPTGSTPSAPRWPSGPVTALTSSRSWRPVDCHPGFGLHESQYGLAELQIAVEVAHSYGLPITAHAHGPDGIADAVTAGVDGVEHCTFATADGVALDENTVERLAALGTFVGATEAWLPDGPPFPPAAASRLEQCWRNFARMHRPGCKWLWLLGRGYRAPQAA